MDFFAEMFELGFEYSTINTHRSAISVFHEPIEGCSVGKTSKVCDLMKDVYKKDLQSLDISLCGIFKQSQDI